MRKEIVLKIIVVLLLLMAETSSAEEVLIVRADPNASLKKVSKDSSSSFVAGVQCPGIKDNLPVFYKRLADRMDFPMSWMSGNYTDFNKWKQTAREKVFECLLSKPPYVPFDPIVVAQQDRGSYVAKKILLNITGDSRIMAYLLEPKGKGPFPGMLVMHDHGAKFDIGKEKVIRPIDDADKLPSAQKWIDQLYGGRFIGDELAKRGYVCLATDLLNWSDRGGAGYDGQQALASNLLHFGYSFAGLIAYEDLRSAQFIAEHPLVDAKRIGAIGLSLGSFRTWQVCALSDHVSAGVAVCWMATVKGLMYPGGNQTRGQSAFTMIHPGLMNYLDYPDVAGLACPKPMLFYNGTKDGLFPVDSVNEAYKKLHTIWKSQNADDVLETRLWDVEHVFDKPMQDDAFAWLDKHLNKTSNK